MQINSTIFNMVYHSTQLLETKLLCSPFSFQYGAVEEPHQITPYKKFTTKSTSNEETSTKGKLYSLETHQKLIYQKQSISSFEHKTLLVLT